MTTKEKLIQRFLSQPKDFTFDELVHLFKKMDFCIDNKGKTSGSRVLFINEEKGLAYAVHKPHPSSIIKRYVMKDVLRFLLENELITIERS